MSSGNYTKCIGGVRHEIYRDVGQVMIRASANRAIISVADHVLFPGFRIVETIGANGTVLVNAMRSGRILHGRSPRQNRGGVQTTEEDRPTRGIQQPIAGCVEVGVRLQLGEIGTREGEA